MKRQFRRTSGKRLERVESQLFEGRLQTKCGWIHLKKMTYINVKSTFKGQKFKFESIYHNLSIFIIELCVLFQPILFQVSDSIYDMRSRSTRPASKCAAHPVLQWCLCCDLRWKSHHMGQCTLWYLGVI